MATAPTALALLAACGTVQHLEIEIPDEFLRLKTTGPQTKATTSDDGLLFVREVVDEHGGDLVFWAAKIQREYEQRGYELQRRTDITDAIGRRGIVTQWHTETDGEHMSYLLALFVRRHNADNVVRTAEFVATKDVYAKHVDAVMRALRTIRP